jgi:hypothetical protein
VAAAAAFAIGFLLPPLLAATTYRLEFVTSLGWSATVTSGPTPFKEVATTLGWLASVFSGPTPFKEIATPFGWSALVELIPQPLKEVVTPLGWSALVELIPQPLKEAVTAMGFSVSVSSGPTPFTHRESPLSIYGALNLTKTDAFNILRTDGWWIASDLKPAGGVSVDATDVDFPYKVGVHCKSPPCRLRVFLPFAVSDVNITMTAGNATYLLAGLGNGALATITLDEPGGTPFYATIGWISEYSLTVTDYKGGSRAAELRMVYADGTEAVLSPGASVLPVYPVVNMSWSPAGRLAFDPSNTRCRFLTSVDSSAMLLAPPTAVNRCEFWMLYVLGSSLEGVSASPQIGGLYRVGGRLVDEEGSPVPGRRVFVLLQGNTTRPAEAVTGPDGRFSALVYVPPSNRTRLLTVRFPGEPALMPSSKVLEIPGAGAGAAPTAEVPGSVYAFLGVMIAAFAAVVVLSFAGASRRAQAVYRSRRVLR